MMIIYCTNTSIEILYGSCVRFHMIIHMIIHMKLFSRLRGREIKDFLFWNTGV